MAVYFNNEKQKWHARKFIGGRSHHIGWYETEPEAKTAVSDFTQMMNSAFPLKKERIRDPQVPYPKSMKAWQETSRNQIKELSRHKYAVKIDTGGASALGSL